MRILMLNNEYPPLGGGTGSVNQALLNCFSQQSNIEFDLVTSALGKNYEEEQLSNYQRLFKVPVDNHNIHHSSNRELLSYAARALNLSLQLHRKKNYDLCWAWSTVPAGGVAWALHSRSNLKYFVRVSGPDIPGFEQRYSYLYPVLSPIIQKIWQKSLIVVAKCTGEAQMIQRVNKDINVTLIPNGVDLNVFSPGSPAPDDGPLRLICVARLIERKGQHHLIQAVQSLVQQGLDIELTLVGTGDSENAYKERVKRSGISEHVHFLGYVSREKIPELYRNAHVFVLPSYNEGMSVSTLEAIASGLPAVVTQTGGTDELVQHGKNGFVFKWGDVRTLSMYLRQLAKERQAVRSMGKAAREHAAQFSWGSVADKYLTFFAHCLSS